MNRTIIIILFFMVACVNTKAQVIFENSDFSSALTKAKTENKKVFVDCYTSWCGPCKMLASKVFTDPRVGSFMNAEFINIKLDMEKGEGIEFRKRFKINAFPTLLILNNTGEEINRSVGATAEIDSFISNIKVLSDVGNCIKELKNKYIKDVCFADSYLEAVISRGIYEDSENALEEVFVKRTPYQRYVETSFEIYNEAIKTVDEKVAELILKDRDNALKYMGIEKYNKFIEDKVLEKVISLYMGDIKTGVRTDKCTDFINFGEKYSDINKTNIYKYFASSYIAACNRDVEKFLEVSLSYFAKADENMKKNIRRFTYRLATTSGKSESLARFNENCKQYSSGANAN